MSLIIKGMKLPKTGRIDISIDAKGKIYSETPGLAFWKYAAVEIPTPHGRMIDADALFEAMGLDTVKEVMLRNWKFTTAWGVPIIEIEAEEK